MPNLEPLETIDSATRADPQSEGRQMSQAEVSNSRQLPLSLLTKSGNKWHIEPWLGVASGVGRPERHAPKRGYPVSCACFLSNQAVTYARVSGYWRDNCRKPTDS